MNDLLKLAIDGHGGMQRWEQISRFRAAAAITGAICAPKGKPDLLGRRRAGGRDPRPAAQDHPIPAGQASTQPGSRTGRRSRPAEGVLVAERLDPAASFAGHDPPVALGRLPGGVLRWRGQLELLRRRRSSSPAPTSSAEEIEAGHEDGQVWRSLLVTYPETIVAHCRQQTHYFDDAGLVRRLDYTVDILGGGWAYHHPSQIPRVRRDHGPDPPPRLRPQPRRLPRPRLGLDRHRRHQRHLQLNQERTTDINARPDIVLVPSWQLPCTSGALAWRYAIASASRVT